MPCQCPCHTAVSAMSLSRPRYCLCRNTVLTKPMPMPVPCNRLCHVNTDAMPVLCHAYITACRHAHIVAMCLSCLMCPRLPCHHSSALAIISCLLSHSLQNITLLSLAHVKANVHLDRACGLGRRCSNRDPTLWTCGVALMDVLRLKQVPLDKISHPWGRRVDEGAPRLVQGRRPHRPPALDVDLTRPYACSARSFPQEQYPVLTACTKAPPHRKSNANNPVVDDTIDS
ncbi:hypothetical protein FXO37_28028 [Capsicum annuum]|nr:hypothetical protein FXO37_28028 [Capsicum annuum]